MGLKTWGLRSSLHRFVLALPTMVWVVLSSGCGAEEQLPVTSPERWDLRGRERLLLESVDGVRRIVSLETGVLVYIETFTSQLTFYSPDAGTLERHGGEGRGPGEFRFEPGSLVRLSKDTLAVLDPTGRRIVLFDNAGSEIGIVHLKLQLPPLIARVEADRFGGLYVLLDSAPKPELLDSLSMTTIYRIEVATSDLIAVWAGPPSGVRQYRSQQGDGVMTRTGPFAAEPLFAVDATGRLWRVMDRERRIETYHVGNDDRHAGEWSRPPVRITDYERDSVAESWRKVWPQYELTFPEVKPTFDDIIIDEEDRAWLRVTGDNEAAVTYEIFDGWAENVAVVVLPARHLIVGFATSRIYTVHEDALGRQQLYEIPAPDESRPEN